MAKLTKRTVDALKADPAKDTYIWDDEIKGFGVRARPSGVKYWLLQYRTKHGQIRRHTLGRVTELTPTQARDLAEELRPATRKGADPVKERAADRNAKTVSQLCDEYLKASEGRIKASTLAADRGRIDAHVKPLLGKRPVAALTAKDIEQFIQDVSAGKTAAKLGEDEKRPRGGLARGGKSAALRATDMLGAILQRAVRDRILTSNPARGLRRPKTNPLPPPFSFEAVERLGKAMRELKAEGEPAVGIRAIRHLLLTGFRRMEGLTLQWGVVDSGAHCARLPDTKTGPQIRPLGQAALNHLAAFKPKDAKPKDYVFPGSGKAGHYVGAPKAWARIAEKAEITDVSLHGLRHWFASAAAGMGFSELIIAGLLGHSVRSVTGRYATTPDSAIILAADRVSQRLADALDGRKRAEKA
jgi:integrase